TGTSPTSTTSSRSATQTCTCNSATSARRALLDAPGADILAHRVATTGTHATTASQRRVTTGIPAAGVPPPRIAAGLRRVRGVCSLAHAGCVRMFAALGHPRLAAFNVGSVAVWIAAALVNRRGRSTLAMGLIALEVVVHAVLAVAALGW